MMNIQKRKNHRHTRAQITAEYAILVAVLAAGLVAMQTYVNRSLSARLKDAADYPLSVEDTNFITSQYEPGYYSSDSLSDSTARGYTNTQRGLGSRASGTFITHTLQTEIIDDVQ